MEHESSVKNVLTADYRPLKIHLADPEPRQITLNKFSDVLFNAKFNSVREH